MDELGTFHLGAVDELWASKEIARAKQLGIEAISSVNTAGPKKGLIAQIPFKGVMVCEDTFFSWGINRLISAIEKSASDPDISAIMLDTHSGGGEVYAAQRLSNCLKAVKKPVGMYIDGLCASGAYWAGVNCDLIIAGGAMTMVGSIGVVSTNNKAYLDYIRDNIISVYADGSEKKHEFEKMLLAEDYEGVKVKFLNPARKEFKRLVKAARPNIDEQAFNGAMFYANQAMRLGIVDGVGNRQYALNRLRILTDKLARSQGAKKALNVV